MPSPKCGTFIDYYIQEDQPTGMEINPGGGGTEPRKEVRYCPGGAHGGGCGLPLRDLPGRYCVGSYGGGANGAISGAAAGRGGISASPCRHNVGI